MRNALVLLFMTAAEAAAATQTLKYTVIMAGHPAGSQVVEVNSTKRTIDYEFNDRGRGPKTHTVMEPGAMTTTGVDYFKAAVDETFAEGKWSNGAESGSVGAPASGALP